MQQNAQVIAQLDCLLCFAHNAQKYNYHRPVLVNEPVLDIKDGRHPVIEQQLPPGDSYIANDINAR
jgi:DNA mismatch repair protein MutS